MIGLIGEERTEEFFPPHSPGAPIIVDQALRTSAMEPTGWTDALLELLPQSLNGSNNWVVDGTMTASGLPLLANDPHLGLAVPGIWYMAHLEAPGLSVVGATLPGIPAIIVGHNDTIAWGVTNTGPDTQDLFIERIDPADPARYLTPDGSAPFERREEVIRVKGEAPVTLSVRATRHGPVLSDLLPDDGLFGDGHVVALAWTALAEDDRTAQALLELDGAADWAEFVAAAEDVAAPMQNIFYADTGGHIGLIAPGRVPIRRRGDGRWPVPGWSGEYDWQGWIPFADLPRALDPPGGLLFNANNRLVPLDYPYLLTADWEPPFRARRLAELLVGDRHDLAGFAAVQADQLSLLARDLLPIMLAAEALSPAAAEAQAELAAWDRVMRADAPEPLLFAAWYRELSRLIYADELGDLFASFWGLRPEFMERILTRRQVWCDDVATPAVESCAELSARALELALADLAARFGADPADWRWGTAHPARMAHPILGDQPWLAWLVDIVVASGGGGTTVDVGHYRLSDQRRPFVSTHAASYRGLYDLGALERSRFVATTGQSGNPLSPHYRDLTALWAAGATVPMSAAEEAGGHGRLRLLPAR
jgi:penicillin amidase